MALWQTGVMRGTFAAMPAAGPSGNTGRLYYSTDTQQWFRDNGTTWDNQPTAAPIAINVLVISTGGSAIAWVVPAALTEFNGSLGYRSQADLTNATEARVVLTFPSVALLLSPPTLAAQYSTDGGSTWNYLDGGTGPSVAYSSLSLTSSWITLAAGAQADVLLRVVASGGDGTTSINFGSVYLQVK